MIAAIESGSPRTDYLAAAMIAAVCLVALPAIGATPMNQDQVLEHGYGFGVHAFFAGDYQRAHDDLDQVIQGGIKDPRAWYFRGLAALKLGRLDEAEADFERGADIEATSAALWPVGRSLERVQGRQRLALERHRIRARVLELQQRERAIADRYRGIETRQGEVRRRVRPEGVGGDPLGLFTDPAPSTDAPEPVARPVAEEPEEGSTPPAPVEDVADGVREPADDDNPVEERPAEASADEAFPE